ncbi:MAG: hypothetical protein R2877_02295 [Bdellovibrionota bacterium]
MLHVSSSSMRSMLSVVSVVQAWVAKHDEREQALLNQLLVEMDGLKPTMA